MKYVSREPPPDDINVSPEHPLKEAALLVAGLGALFVAIAAIVFYLADLVVAFVPAATEARVFASWWPDDVVALDDQDPRLHATRGLLKRLEHRLPDARYAFRLGVTVDETPNAMALPGGLIVVTTGLLDQVETENELAFVLGHELGHFHNRDHIRGVGRGVALSLLVGAVAGSNGGGLGLRVADLTLRGFNRRQEAAADRYGLAAVQREYGHVNASWRFFERLTSEPGRVGEVLAYISTHPYAGERADDLRRHANEQGCGGCKGILRSSRGNSTRATRRQCRIERAVRRATKLDGCALVRRETGIRFGRRYNGTQHLLPDADTRPRGLVRRTSEKSKPQRPNRVE